jgi:VCBS repeat-containing protein
MASDLDSSSAQPAQLPPDFDGLQYIASYSDLIQAFGADPTAGAQHYLAFGEAEGRKADAFNTPGYLARYPDLQAAFGDDGDAATAHYIQFGFFEGRSYNDPPTAVDSTGEATEDGGPVKVNVLGNDTDPDVGDTLTIVSVDDADTVGGVQISANGSAVFYNPRDEFQELNAGQTATDTFTYTIQDEAGAQSTATVTMNIAGVDEAPPAPPTPPGGQPPIETVETAFSADFLF